MVQRIEAKSLLNQLTEEIDQWDPAMFQIPDGCPDEQILAKLEDPFLRKLWQLQLFYKREANRVRADLSVQPDDVDSLRAYRRTSNKAEMLTQLFWYLTCSQYNLWDEDDAGVRKDWNIVRVHHHIRGPEDFLKQLFGGR